MRQKLLVFFFVTAFLFACTPIQATEVSTSTPVVSLLLTSLLTPSFTPSLTLTPKPTFTITPTKTPKPTFTPSPTPVPIDLILSDYPLATGATWKYAVEVSYQHPGADIGSNVPLDKWSGYVTVKVVEQKTGVNGKVVFSMEQKVEPVPPPQVWLQWLTWEYTVSGDGIFDGSLKIYQWPLSDGLNWIAFDDLDYEWGAGIVEEVATPFKRFKNCYEFRLITRPDTSILTFCPGVGFVTQFYSHHGDPQTEVWTLIAYQAGKFSK